MIAYTQEQLKKIFHRLPDPLKDWITSEESASILGKIYEKYNVMDKAGKISLYAGYVLLGVLPPNEFKKILQEEVKLNPEDALHISEGIDSQIFSKVRIYLQKLHPLDGFRPHVEDHKPVELRKPSEAPQKVEIPPSQEGVIDLRQQKPEEVKPEIPPESFDKLRTSSFDETQDKKPPAEVKRFIPPEKDEYLESIEDERPPEGDTNSH